MVKAAPALPVIASAIMVVVAVAVILQLRALNKLLFLLAIYRYLISLVASNEVRVKDVFFTVRHLTTIHLGNRASSTF